MARYILENIGKILLLLLAVSFVCFVLVSVSPIDPVQANVGQAAYINMSPEQRAQLAQYWGADTPLLERYAHWLWGFIRGDMGMSLRYNAPVAEVIASRSLNSLLLLSIAWAASGIFGFVLGVVSGMARGSVLDRAVKGYCYVIAAMPAFWIGLLFLTVFSVILGWFPMGFSVPIGVASDDVSLLDALQHLALPAITLSLVGVANIALHTREKTIDVMGSDHIRYAQAKGATRWQALWNDGLRSIMLPAMTLQFASISEIFGGAVLVEEVFSYPGLGQAAVTAGLGGDVALLAGISVISAMLVFGGNLVANILYGVVDPRIRRAGRYALG